MIVLIISNVSLTLFAQNNPVYIDHYYTQTIYPAIRLAQQTLFSWLPFSLAEICLVSFICLITRIIYLCLKELLALEDLTLLPSWIAKWIFLTLSLLLCLQLCFTLCWGLNYYRPPLASLLNWQLPPPNKEELLILAQDLISQANKDRLQTYQNEQGLADLEKGLSPHLKLIWDDGVELQAKPVWFSSLMSYSMITGFYFPFTGEANINTNTPSYQQPATIAHEMAHQQGYAREDEANFIAWQQSQKSDVSVEFRYSGTMLALAHTLNAAANVLTTEEYASLWQLMTPEVDADFVYSRQFWDNYRGPVKQASEHINDIYLKMNNQQEGIASYGRMVDLLLAERLLVNQK